jgi:hypothetical protein
MLTRWRTQKALELFAGVLFGALAVATTAGLFVDRNVTIALTCITFAGGLYWVFSQLARIDSTLIAKHLDRVLPEAGESATLFLLSDRELSGIGRIQRERVNKALTTRDPTGLLPAGPLKRASMFGVGAVAILAVGQVIPPITTNPPDGSAIPGQFSDSSSRITAIAPGVASAQISITPPTYTGLSVSSGSDWSVEVPEGSKVEWTVVTDTMVDYVAFEMANGEAITPTRVGKIWKAESRLNSSRLYHVELRSGSDTTVSPFHRLTVIPDTPPSVAVTSHQQRTVLPIEGPWNVMVEAVAQDDYAIKGGDIVATVTSGSGESVVFREEVIPLEASAPGEAQTDLSATLDLEQLGMVIGDELYFYVRVADNREPDANRARTETFFVTIPDTSEVLEISSMGMAVNPLAESLLSQRQIIIETERLIARRDSLPEVPFNNQSNVVGMNQKTVRLRYGQFLGEEDESGGDLAEVHLHDTEVGATTYTPDVRIRLQGALAQMWESELHLRLHNPEEALPYEYRALELLIELQEMRRREYVKRVGFEPAPLRDEARLTGDLGDINDTQRHLTLDDIRTGTISEALETLRSLSVGVIPQTGKTTLRAARTVIASNALDVEFDLIPALESMRRLLADLDAAIICDSCIGPVEHGLWSILPAARPRPTVGSNRSGSIGKAYLDELRRQQ